MEKIITTTMDKQKENLERLTVMFPTICTEVVRWELDGKEYETQVEGAKEVVKKVIDPVKLRELVGDTAGATDEIFQFTWAGKRAAERLATTPTSKTLRPCVEESVGKDGTLGGFDSQNLYIEGDNLEVLKLLEQAYTGQIKMIYIDPPYNTGSCAFVYDDDYESSASDWAEQSNEFDEEGNRIFKNTGSDGRYHTNWLNMMYPRLLIAHKLLKDDGVIFISIDDNEVHNLRKICDDVFGAENFEAQFYIKVRHENRILREDSRYQLVMEHILCYRKDSYNPNRRPKEKSSEEDYIYDIKINGTPKETVRIGTYDVEIYNAGDYELIKSANGSLKEYQIRGSLISQSGSASEYYEHNLRERKDKDGEGALYKVIGMGTRGDGLGYRYIRQPNDFSFKNGFYYQGKPLNQVESKGLPYPNFYDFVQESNNVGYEGEMEFKNGKKPLALLRKVFEISKITDDKEALVMDFFSGSASTAHAVMSLNGEDGGKRKHIMIQLPQEIDEKHESFRLLKSLNKPTNICEIGKERIRRAGAKIKEENQLLAPNIDTGFRVLKLDNGNLRDVHKRPGEYTIESLLDSIDKVESGRTGMDLLFTTMLYTKVSLDSIIETQKIEDKEVFVVRDSNLPEQIYLACCFEEGMSENVVKQMAMLKPSKIIFSDKSFASDDVKISMQQIIKTYSPATRAAVLESM